MSEIKKFQDYPKADTMSDSDTFLGVVGDETKQVEKKVFLSEINTALSQLKYGDTSGSINLLDINKDYISDFGGVLKVDENKVIIEGIWYCFYIIDVKKHTNYYFQGTILESSTYAGVNIYNANVSEHIKYRALNTTFNTGENDKISILLYSGTDQPGKTIYSELMLSEGTEPKPYEPYIRSVKMLDKEVSNVKSSLNDYGLDNKFDGQLEKGYIDWTNGSISYDENSSTSTNLYPCNVGDKITLKYNILTDFRIAYFRADKSFIVRAEKDNSLEMIDTVPNDAKYFRYQISKPLATISNAGVYINNQIDEIKADLTEKYIECNSLNTLDDLKTLLPHKNYIGYGSIGHQQDTSLRALLGNPDISNYVEVRIYRMTESDRFDCKVVAYSLLGNAAKEGYMYFNDRNIVFTGWK